MGIFSNRDTGQCKQLEKHGEIFVGELEQRKRFPGNTGTLPAWETFSVVIYRFLFFQHLCHQPSRVLKETSLQQLVQKLGCCVV